MLTNAMDTILTVAVEGEQNIFSKKLSIYLEMF